MSDYKKELEEIVVYLYEWHKNFVISNDIIKSTGISEEVFNIISKSDNINMWYIKWWGEPTNRGYMTCWITEKWRKYYEEEIKVSKLIKFIRKIIRSEFIKFFLDLYKTFKK